MVFNGHVQGIDGTPLICETPHLRENYFELCREGEIHSVSLYTSAMEILILRVCQNNYFRAFVSAQQTVSALSMTEEFLLALTESSRSTLVQWVASISTIFGRLHSKSEIAAIALTSKKIRKSVLMTQAYRQFR